MWGQRSRGAFIKTALPPEALLAKQQHAKEVKIRPDQRLLCAATGVARRRVALQRICGTARPLALHDPIHSADGENQLATFGAAFGGEVSR